MSGLLSLLNSTRENRTEIKTEMESCKKNGRRTKFSIPLIIIKGRS
jgi:hypothetical protein